jgi:hypothetical protein
MQILSPSKIHQVVREKPRSSFFSFPSNHLPIAKNDHAIKKGNPIEEIQVTKIST